jgi:hypothetical protein
LRSLFDGRPRNVMRHVTTSRRRIEWLITLFANPG